MSIVLQKGSGFNATYTSPDYPTLTSDWTGSLSGYAAYPGTAAFTQAMVKVSNSFTASLSPAQVLSLPTGASVLVATITNPVLGVTISSLNYVTVTEVPASSLPLCRLYVTVVKSDNTAAGKQIAILTGASVSYGWAGVAITVANATADVVGDIVVGTEKVTTTTNAAGYAEIYVAKGLPYVVTSPAFGKSITVATAGLDAIDLSTLF